MAFGCIRTAAIRLPWLVAGSIITAQAKNTSTQTIIAITKPINPIVWWFTYSSAPKTTIGHHLRKIASLWNCKKSTTTLKYLTQLP